MKSRAVERLPNYEALKKIADTPFLRGNAVELLVDGQASFDSILEDFGALKRYALVQFYIVRDDGLGRRLKAAMIDCAKRGVDVFFLYDEIGSKDLPRAYLDELEAAGIGTSKFNSTLGRRNRFQLNFRNHRKSVIVDGVEAGSAATTWATSTSASTPKSARGVTRTCISPDPRRSLPRPSSSPTGTGPSAAFPSGAGSPRRRRTAPTSWRWWYPSRP